MIPVLTALMSLFLVVGIAARVMEAADKLLYLRSPTAASVSASVRSQEAHTATIAPTVALTPTPTLSEPTEAPTPRVTSGQSAATPRPTAAPTATVAPTVTVTPTATPQLTECQKCLYVLGVCICVR